MRHIFFPLLLLLTAVAVEGSAGLEAAEDLTLGSLAWKARVIQARLEADHLSPEGLLKYEIDAETGEMTSTGEVALETFLYLASQSLRFAVTGDSTARANVIRTLQAVRKLSAVTGKKGLLARCYEIRDESKKYGKNWYSGARPYEHYQWKNEISRDPYVGAFFSYRICYQVIAAEEIRQLIRVEVEELMDHILSQGMAIEDINGKKRFSNRFGLTFATNTLAILQAAYQITGKKIYRDKYQTLTRGWSLPFTAHPVAKVSIKVPFSHIFLFNHDMDYHDNLLFMAYYTLIPDEETPYLKKRYTRAMRRFWKNYVRGEGNSFFDIIYNAVLPEQSRDQNSLEQALHSLKSIPADGYAFYRTLFLEDHIQKATIINTRGLLVNFFEGKLKSPEVYQQSAVPLPMEKRPLTNSWIWNQNPRRLTGPARTVIYAGHDFLLPYWMGRYHGFISAAE